MNPCRQKVEGEGECRLCSWATVDQLDAAHLIPRSVKSGQGFDDPDSCIPLCSAAKGGPGCHEDYDAHRVGVLGFLTLTEEVYAVLAAGGLEAARRILCPGDYGTRIRTARGLAGFDDAPAPSPIVGQTDIFEAGA